MRDAMSPVEEEIFHVIQKRELKGKFPYRREIYEAHFNADQTRRVNY